MRYLPSVSVAEADPGIRSTDSSRATSFASLLIRFLLALFLCIGGIGALTSAEVGEPRKGERIVLMEFSTDEILDSAVGLVEASSLPPEERRVMIEAMKAQLDIPKSVQNGVTLFTPITAVYNLHLETGLRFEIEDLRGKISARGVPVPSIGLVSIDPGVAPFIEERTRIAALLFQSKLLRLFFLEKKGSTP